MNPLNNPIQKKANELDGLAKKLNEKYQKGMLSEADLDSYADEIRKFEDELHEFSKGLNSGQLAAGMGQIDNLHSKNAKELQKIAEFKKALSAPEEIICDKCQKTLDQSAYLLQSKGDKYDICTEECFKRLSFFDKLKLR